MTFSNCLVSILNFAPNLFATNQINTRLRLYFVMAGSNFTSLIKVGLSFTTLTNLYHFMDYLGHELAFMAFIGFFAIVQQAMGRFWQNVSGQVIGARLPNTFMILKEMSALMT